MHASVGGMESLCVMVSVTGGVYAHGKGGHNSSPTGPLPSPPPHAIHCHPHLHSHAAPARKGDPIYVCLCGPRAIQLWPEVRYNSWVGKPAVWSIRVSGTRVMSLVDDLVWLCVALFPCMQVTPVCNTTRKRQSVWRLA